ncbi:MAG: fibronectin type III domain-containing protein [Spirochaetia bacterium]|nr:fibronectin type III domain-containing protein [Spirochaetia bacterium]
MEAVNSNHSSSSSESSFFTEITTIPADPSNISVSASGISSVKVSWDDNARNEDGYYLEARRKDRFTGWTDWELECTLNPNATEKYIMPVIGAIEFRIWASNEVGDSAKVYSGTYYR